jgi:GTPase SAR1 family protein
MYQKEQTDPKKYSFQIWTVGGSERYRTLITQIYSNARVCLLCFDMTNISSFQELPFWFNETKRNCPYAIVLLVGLKGDEGDSSTIKPSEILKLVSVTYIVQRMGN